MPLQCLLPFSSLFFGNITNSGVGYVITLSNIINKQAGSLMTWSTHRISSTTVQWVFPWELYNYWMNIKCFSLKKNKKQDLNQLPEGKTNHTMKSLPSWMQGKSKVGGRLHKYSTIISRGYTNSTAALIYLESATSVHSSHSCYPRQRKRCSHP